MTHQISDHLLSRLSEFVSCQFGLHFPRKRWHDLERGIVHAAREFGFKEAGTCAQWLVSSALTREETEILASHLTIGETYFFREKGGFEILETRILPELIDSRRGREQRLRIWSAGCSTGEEPYSIAILLKKLIPDLAEWNVTILATDINPRSLGKATRGIYRDWSFRGIPSWMKDRYFSRSEEGDFEIPYTIRKMVTFANLNLVEDVYPSLVNNTNAMDVIFCRNVLMYFGSKQAEKVVRNFHRSLLEGGWLLVSPCETSPGLFAPFETVQFPEAVFYRKDGKRERPDAAPWIELDKGAMVCPPEPPSVPIPVFTELLAPESHEELESQAESLPYDEAMELYRQGSYRLAAEKLSGFLSTGQGADDSSPLFGKAAALLAQLFADLGNLGEALRWSERAIATDKLNAEMYYLRATIFQEQGNIGEAVASLKQALYLDHAFVLTHFTLGNLSLRQGRKKESAKHFQNALSLLRSYHADDEVPGGEGMTAGRLSEIIETTMAGSL